jgi:hypothetical protein
MIQEQHSRGDMINRRTLLDTLNARPNVSRIDTNELERAFDALSREQVVILGSGGAIRVA